VAGLGDNPRPSRAYVGFYTGPGNLFVCGYQNDRRIRVYECGPEGLGVCGIGSGSGRGRTDGGSDDGGSGVVGECGWRLVKDISCRLLRWTVTDALCVPGSGGSSDAKLLYSTISPTVHAVTLSSHEEEEEEEFDDDDEGEGDDEGGNQTRNRNRNRNRRRSTRSRVTSIANTTDVHEPLNFDEMLGAPPDETLPGFGIWSIRWNPRNNSSNGNGTSTVLAGASDGCCYLFDAERGKTVARYARAHSDDVNAVVYLAGNNGCGGSGGGGGSGNNNPSLSSSPEVFASGSDDNSIKIWDTRVPSGAETGSSVAGNNNGSGGGETAFHAVARPVGVLIGHGAGEEERERERERGRERERELFFFLFFFLFSFFFFLSSSSSSSHSFLLPLPPLLLLPLFPGITYLDSRGDGHHLLSNAKDQTAKLWDLRSGLRGVSAAAAAEQHAAAASPPPAALRNFDYRWMSYPRSARRWRHGADASAVTFTGHEVLSTLIRARFSPLESTGGRFAYSGSSNG
jgi:WD40 repeat protein